MQAYTVLVGVLVACAAAMAMEDGPLIAALQPQQAQPQETELVLVPTAVQGPRQKRGLLLGKYLRIFKRKKKKHLLALTKS